MQEVENPTLQELGYKDDEDLKQAIYDLLRTIKDPEKPNTLEVRAIKNCSEDNLIASFHKMQDLNVVSEDCVFVTKQADGEVPVVRVEFNPTVPHCSLATLIGLTIRIKILRHFPHNLKLDIFIKKGTHSTEDEINKQINDRERIAAAIENQNLWKLIENCIKDDE